MDEQQKILTSNHSIRIALAARQRGNLRLLNSLSELIQSFNDYVEYDLNFRPETVNKYNESLKWAAKDLPHVVFIEDLQLADITELKKKMLSRGCGPSRVNSVIFALRKFLTYCQDVHKIETINPKEIKPMRVPKRQVIFLTQDEIRQFVDSINTAGFRGLRMRTLVEFLLGTGLRISECLSLNRQDIDFKTKEFKIIGKGSKERTAYFTDRAAEWLQRYFAQRKDVNEALFVTFGQPKRLTRFDLSKSFKHYAKLSGLKKKITPHVLRHTMATLMLHNGGNLLYIQQLLGHSSIETTAQYYLGTDQQALKEAHNKFLKFDIE